MCVSVSLWDSGREKIHSLDCFGVKSVPYPGCHRKCHMLAHYFSDTDAKEEGKWPWSFQSRREIRVIKVR